MTPPVRPIPPRNVVKAIVPTADETKYTNTAKPFDVLARPMHRINSPTYDASVDVRNGDPALEAKLPPNGKAGRSGARNPAMFVNSKLFEGLIKNIETFILTIIGAEPFKLIIDEISNKLIGERAIQKILDAIAKAVAQSIEGALFDRFMRVIPAWVPVGRVGYQSTYVYDELQSTPRTVTVEEEREIEGLVTASYQHCNDVPNAQWSHYWHWAFHLRPLPGYRHLIGPGNKRVNREMDEAGTNPDKVKDGQKPKLLEILQIYSQINQNINKGTEPGSLEVLWDAGGMSIPRGDGGTSDGVMFHGNFPFWPQTGDHMWAVGRYVYDCARAFPGESSRAADELMPTMINPCKALAVARFEGVKFPENAGSVPAVRFFFIATSEGGYFNFRPTRDEEQKLHLEQDGKDANGKPKFKGINLRDRDYEFIVDLPPTDQQRGVYPIGHTTDFMDNTLVLRPRLLAQFRFAPFETRNSVKQKEVDDPTDLPADTPEWNKDIFFHTIDLPPGTTPPAPDKDIRPRIEIIQGADPTVAPTQVKITVPLSLLPLPDDASTGRPIGPTDRKELYGFEVALGWYDPVGDETAKLTRVVLSLKNLRMHGRHSTDFAHFKACVNGQWREHTLRKVRISPVPDNPGRPDAPGQTPPSIEPLGPQFEDIELFLPAGARIAVTTHGSWRHGYGEFMENRALPVNPANRNSSDRTLRFGALVELPKELDDELKDLRQKAKDLGPLTPPGVQQRINQIEEVLKVLDKFIGKKTTPHWLVDIDADRTDDPTGDARTLSDADKVIVEKERVSALARALFVEPIAALNNFDEPLGWATFVDPLGTVINTVGTMNPPPDQVGTVEKLVARQQSTGQAVTRVNVFANRVWQLGSGNNLGMQITEYRGETQPVDYSMIIELAAAPVGKPTAPPLPPLPPPPVVVNPIDVTVIPTSVRLRTITPVSIQPASVVLRALSVPSIVPASVVLKPVPTPSIVPASVVLKPVPTPSIVPASVILRQVAQPSIDAASVSVRRIASVSVSSATVRIVKKAP